MIGLHECAGDIHTTATAPVAKTVTEVCTVQRQMQAASKVT
jgi:hypothetical protein